MTRIKLTVAEIRLLDIQRARGIPYPTNILACREAHAAELAALESELQAEPGV